MAVQFISTDNSGGRSLAADALAGFNTMSQLILQYKQASMQEALAQSQLQTDAIQRQLMGVQQQKAQLEMQYAPQEFELKQKESSARIESLLAGAAGQRIANTGNELDIGQKPVRYAREAIDFNLTTEERNAKIASLRDSLNNALAERKLLAAQTSEAQARGAAIPRELQARLDRNAADIRMLEVQRNGELNRNTILASEARYADPMARMKLDAMREGIAQTKAQTAGLTDNLLTTKAERDRLKVQTDLARAELGYVPKRQAAELKKMDAEVAVLQNQADQLMVATEGQRIENRNKPIMNLLQQAMMSANTERIRAETEGTKTQTRIAGSEEGRRASLYALGLPVQVAKNNQELAQYTALKELHDNPGPTVKALMTSLGIDPKDQKQLEPFYTRMLLTGNVNLLQMIAELQQRRDALNLEADKLNGKDKLKQISQLIDYGQEVGLPDEELAPLYNVYNKALVANSLPGVIFGGSGNQYSMDAEGNFSMGGASAGRAPFQISPEELQAAGEVTTKIMTLKREMKGGATTRPTTRPSTRPAAPQQTIGEAIVTDAQQAARKNLYDKMWTSLSLVKQNGDPVQIAWTRQLQEDDYIRGTNQVPNPWNVQNAAGEGTAFGSREMVLKTIAREKNWDESKALNFLTQLDDSSTEERDLISQFQSIRSNEKQQGRFYFMLRMLNSSKIDDKLGMMQDYIKKFDSDTKRRPSISPDDYEQIFKYGIRRKYWTKVDADLMVKMVEGKQGGK